MTLADEMRELAEKKYEEQLNIFAENLKEFIKDEALKGRTKLKIPISKNEYFGDKTATLLNNPNFAEDLEKQLDGFKVSIGEETVHLIFSTYQQRFLYIEW